MKRLILILGILCCIMAKSQTIRVAAASNLKYILEDIVGCYYQICPETSINITMGSSGSLTMQIINGASFDFFMAADTKYPQILLEQGCVAGTIETYAYGKLVLWSNIVEVSKGLDILNDKIVTRIAIAKPEIAPYGKRAVECLKYYKLYEGVKDKLVYADNIAQAAQFAETGNADVALIAYALVFGPEMKNKGNFYVLDTKSYKPVEQTCTLLKGSEQNPEAAKFMKFVLSDECKPIFEKYGFIIPK